MNKVSWKDYKGPAVFVPVRWLMRQNKAVIEHNNILQAQCDDLGRQLLTTQRTVKTLAQEPKLKQYELGKALDAVQEAYRKIANG